MDKKTNGTTVKRVPRTIAPMRASSEAADPTAALNRLQDEVMLTLQLFDDLSPDDVARVRNLAGMLLARADIAPGYIQSPGGGFVPETYDQREQRRDEAEANAGAFAEIVTDENPSTFVPSVRRARILSSKLLVAVERLLDPEIADDRKEKIIGAIDLTWTAFDNVKGETKVCLELLEHIEWCAIGSAPASKVIEGFQREYPREASKLNGGDVQDVLDAWIPARGSPRGPRKKGPAQPQRLALAKDESGRAYPIKWDLFGRLCRSAGILCADALTLKRNWERHRPNDLKAALTRRADELKLLRKTASAGLGP